MKVFIIYDSLFGNTEKIAKTIGETLSLSHDTIVVKADNNTITNMEDVNLLVIGSPTHGGWFTEPIKKFIASLPTETLQNFKVATFDTSFPTTNMGFITNHLAKIFGNAAPRISKKLNKKGATVIDSKIFYVLGKEGPLQEGEIERAQMWANQLHKMITN